MTDKIFKWVSISTLLIVHIFVGYVLYLEYPREVLDIKVQPFPVLTKEVKSGENIIFHTSRCKYYAITPTVNRTFIYENGQTVTLSANSQGRPTGCYEEDMVVPTFRNMPVGCGYIELNSSYKVNFLQTVYYTAKTERLCIIK